MIGLLRLWPIRCSSPTSTALNGAICSVNQAINTFLVTRMTNQERRSSIPPFQALLLICFPHHGRSGPKPPMPFTARRPLFQYLPRLSRPSRRLVTRLLNH
jgi:hypothetical protein